MADSAVGVVMVEVWLLLELGVVVAAAGASG
jgi:hypothetical protein